MKGQGQKYCSGIWFELLGLDRESAEIMTWKKLKNLTCLVENDGEVTIGRYGPVRCVASACDEDSQLAVLVKRDIETIDDLLERLGSAVDRAWEQEIYTDEING